MTNPAQPGLHQAGPYPGHQPSPGPAGTGQFAPVGSGPFAAPARGRRPGRRPPPLAVGSAALLVLAGGLAAAGSFTTMATEVQRISGNQDLTLAYTAWTLRESGTLHLPIDFHAPHFGYPLAVSALLVLVGAALLLFGAGRLAAAARPVAMAGAGLLAGTVWAVAMSVSAELDDVEHRDGYHLDWTTGVGFWLLLGAGAVAVVGGVLAMAAPQRSAAEEPATPRCGFPAIGQPYPPPGARQSGAQAGQHPTPPSPAPAAEPADPGPAEP